VPFCFIKIYLASHSLVFMQFPIAVHRTAIEIWDLDMVGLLKHTG
jgi:hypothetical protein